jgi:hypothetical protein
MLTVWVLLLVTQNTINDPDVFSTVDNISSEAECRTLGDRITKFYPSGGYGRVRFQCVPVVKATTPVPTPSP